MKTHPVHMMLVHFPAALLPMDTLFGIASIYFQEDKLMTVGYYCLMTGVIGGWIAVLTGLFDFFTRLLKPGRPVPLAGYLHMGLQFVMIMGFTIVFSLEYKSPYYVTSIPTWMWITKASLLGILFAGNYFGGELVLRHIAKEV